MGKLQFQFGRVMFLSNIMNVIITHAERKHRRT